MITKLYELLTGRPWTTTRHMAAEYGPPPGARYAHLLTAYSDLDLIRYQDQILTEVAHRASIAAELKHDRRQGHDYSNLLLDCGCPAGTFVAVGHETHCPDRYDHDRHDAALTGATRREVTMS